MWNAWFDRGGAFVEFDALTREIEAALQRNTPDATRLDVREDDAAYVLAAELPGLNAEALKLDVHDRVLTIDAERAIEGPKGYAARHRERTSYRFARTFTLPDNVDAAAISAKLENGALTVTLPKRPAQEPRRITVNA